MLYIGGPCFIWYVRRSSMRLDTVAGRRVDLLKHHFVLELAPAAHAPTHRGDYAKVAVRFDEELTA